MKEYLMWILFFTLSLVDSSVNLLTAIFHVYPKLDLAGDLWIRWKMSWAIKESEKMDDKRLDMYIEAEKLKQKAKDLDNGSNS